MRPSRRTVHASRMLMLPGVVLLTILLHAQTPPPAHDLAKDPLERTTPQSSVYHFLEACHARDYGKAARYLDLQRLSPADRAKQGPELARQLEDLLDDTPFDIATLSRAAEGDQSDDLSSNLDLLDTFHVDGQTLALQLERRTLKNGLQVWMVSADSVALIPEAHKLVAETPFESKLPQPLVTLEIFDTPVWRWLALIVIGMVLWLIATLLAKVIVRLLRPLTAMPHLQNPVRMTLLAGGLRIAVGFVPPAALARLLLDRTLDLGLWIGGAWAGAVVIDWFAERWHSRLDPRVQAVTFSVLPLGRQIVKLCLFLAAILSVVSTWGYNTSTILAGLGVGGLAVALAAQKTIENLFGGVSVIGDRPVLVGDVCRFGDRTGTIMHIGLRSTRIRTPERTVISVPNAQFSSMMLENISGRDKIFFHPTLNLRRDTTPEQLRQVLASIRKILAENAKVEPAGRIPVRFNNVGSYSLDVEVAAYVVTRDYDEFLEMQQDLLLKMLQAVEQAGTGLAVPLQESVTVRS